MSKKRKRNVGSPDKITVNTFLKILEQPIEPYRGSDEALIREVMARFGYSRDEAIENLRAWGGI
jgi:hypothetical protein